MASLFLVYRYSALKVRPPHGSSASNARFDFQIEGCLNDGSRKSTLAAGVAPGTAGGASGSALNRPPVVGHDGKPVRPQPMKRVATPGFENGLDIHTDAAAPWNRPTPPRTCAARSWSKR